MLVNMFLQLRYIDCQGIPIGTSMMLTAHNVPGLTTIPLQYIGVEDLSPNCDTIDGPNFAYSCNGNNLGFTGNGVGAVEEHTYQFYQ